MYDNKNNSANVPNGSSMAYLLFVANDNNMMNIKYITPPLLKTIIFLVYSFYIEMEKKHDRGILKNVNPERAFPMISPI